MSVEERVTQGSVKNKAKGLFVRVSAYCADGEMADTLSVVAAHSLITCQQLHVIGALTEDFHHAGN